MVYRSKAVSRLITINGKPEQVDEQCCMCDRELPGGVTILRKHENNRIICVLCLTEIAAI